MSSYVEVDYRNRPANTPQKALIASIFLILGLGILVALITFISQNETITGADVENFNARVWNFLRAYGVVRPLLAIIAAIYLIRLSFRLLGGHIIAARWARVILAWMIIATTIIVLFVVNININSETVTGEATGSDFVLNILPWVALLLLLLTGYLTLSRSMHLFTGDEDITSKNTRNAWSLLAPTLLIFLTIGIGPLEQVFLTSLTDAPFASDDEVEYIGFRNYVRLFGIRLDSIPCETDEATGACLTEIDENGNEITLYPNPRRYLADNVVGYREDAEGNSLGDLQYRPYPYGEFDLFGTRYVISARDPDFLDAVLTSAVYSVVAISIQVVLGLGVAMLLAQKIRGLGPLRVALLIPMAIPTLIATQFWDIMLAQDQSGIVNSVLLDLGWIDEPQLWFTERRWQLPAIILVIVWKETPPMALLLLPGLTSISPEIYQAASVDGANRWQKFFRITLPILRPTIGIALILRTIIALRAFDIFHVLLGSNRFSMATYAHNTLLETRELGYSSAISVAIFLTLLIFSVIYMRTLRIDQA